MLNRFVLDPEVAKPLIEKYAYLMRDKVGKILVPDPEQLAFGAHSRTVMQEEGYRVNKSKYIAHLALVPRTEGSEELVLQKLVTFTVPNMEEVTEYFIDDLDINHARW